jgi:menaquinone-dependent protoporphyrinogen oxidase
VAHASRMGSTAEIAQRIGEQLRGAGHDVDVRACAEALETSDYDAVIIGSALYVGRWLKEARRYLRSQSESLSRRPTWLFQSGPCGAGFDLNAVQVPRAVRRLARLIGNASVTTFGGRLDRDLAPGRLSRWMATGSLAGDFRDWDLVRDWTGAVIAELAASRISSEVDRPGQRDDLAPLGGAADPSDHATPRRAIDLRGLT